MVFEVEFNSSDFALEVLSSHVLFLLQGLKQQCLCTVHFQTNYI